MTARGVGVGWCRAMLDLGISLNGIQCHPMPYDAKQCGSIYCLTCYGMA